ncbi:MAG: hypothetical protein N2B02_03325, partial [Amylibacter sp.]
MEKLTGFTAQSPFNLENADAYAVWRESKLAAGNRALNSGFVTILDPMNMRDSEVEAILSRCRDTNIALYSTPPKSDDSILRRNLRAMAERLG